MPDLLGAVALVYPASAGVGRVGRNPIEWMVSTARRIDPCNHTTSRPALGRRFWPCHRCRVDIQLPSRCPISPCPVLLQVCRGQHPTSPLLCTIAIGACVVLWELSDKVYHAEGPQMDHGELVSDYPSTTKTSTPGKHAHRPGRKRASHIYLGLSLFRIFNMTDVVFCPAWTPRCDFPSTASSFQPISSRLPVSCTRLLFPVSCTWPP